MTLEPALARPADAYGLGFRRLVAKIPFCASRQLLIRDRGAGAAVKDSIARFG